MCPRFAPNPVEESLNRSFRTTLGFVLLLALVLAGFASGKAIGSRLRPHNDASVSPWIPGLRSDNGARSTPTAPPGEVFASVLDKVQQDYVGSTGSTPPTNARLTEGALGRMFASLQDPHTVYLNPSQTESRINSLLGRRSGIGAELTVVISRSKHDDVDTSFLTVKSAAPGSPADRAGLRAGDRITEINGQWVIAYPVLSERSRGISTSPDGKHDGSRQQGASQIMPGISAARAIQALTSGVGTSLLLTVERAGRTAPDLIHVTTGATNLPTLEHRLPAPGVTYLRINEFNSDTSSAVDAVLSHRQDWSVGIVIDLRQNAGGVEASLKSRLDGYRCALDLVGHIAQKSPTGQIERRPRLRTRVLIHDAIGTRLI